MFKNSVLNLEKLQKKLVETNRQNILLEEFIKKSHINKETGANDQSKFETIPEVIENKIVGAIRKNHKAK